MEEIISVVQPELAKKKGNLRANQKKKEKTQNLYSAHTLPEKPKCQHNKKKKAYQCQTLTSNDVFYFHKSFYSKPNKLEQDNFILRHVLLNPVKRKRPKTNTRSERAYSKQYIVTKHKKKEKVFVCLAAFCAILKIKEGRIKGVMNRYLATGQGPSENRGGNRKYHAFRSKRESVQKFVMNFKPLESHYCRGTIKRKIYLDPSLSIAKMYRMYEDQSLPGYSVTKSFFRKVFNTSFNIGFGSPRQDVCSDCIQLLERLKFEQSEIEKQRLRTQYRVHKLRAKCFFDKLKEDDPEMVILSFDCQKNLPLPKVADQSAYYSRQLYIYNFTIVEGNSHVGLTKDNVYSYVWTEDQASKGANEISSCLYHCLNKVNLNGKKKIRLVADGCGGQNKNSILIGMVAKWLNDCQHDIPEVEIVFPVTGHSYIPPDRVFALTEKKIRRLETITNPVTYIEIMASNATIHRLVTEVPIFDWKTATKDVLKSTQTFHFQISKSKRIVLAKTGQKVLVRGEISYRNDICNAMTITKRGKTISAISPDRIEGRCNVKIEKLNDVKKLLAKHFGDAWRELPELEYYKNVLAHGENNLPEQDDDEAVNDGPEYLLHDSLEFV